MQSILYCIALDAGKIGSQCRINAKRGEHASRKLRTTITKDSCPFEPPDGAIVSLRAKHENGVKYLYPCTVDGGVVEYEFGSNILASPGTVECEILIVESSGATLCSPCFELYVEDVVYSDDVLETVDEFTALTAALARVLNIEESEASRVTAELARVAAESLREAAEANRNTAEDERAAAELEREAAEELRVSQENARDAAENERVAAEQTRQAQEAARESGEDAREAAEDERVASELARVAAESLRETTEDTRNTAENARAAAEQTRQAQETTRENRENDRNAAEAVRESAETARRSAEQARATAEDERATAEQTRQSQEVAREDNESARTAAEAARANAETARVGSEQTRSTAEAGRVSAEQTRQSQETARQTNTATAIQNANTATDRANTAAKACEDIAGGAFPAHAATHATGGSDPISPASIGAAAASHTHGNLTSGGAVGSTANMPLITGANGVVQTTTTDNMLKLMNGLKVYTSIPNSDLDSCLDDGVYVSAPNGLSHLPRAGLDDNESPFMMMVSKISSMGQRNVQQLFFHDAGGYNTACLAGRTKNEYDDWTDWSIFTTEVTVTQMLSALTTISGLLKGTENGVSAAVGGEDYQEPTQNLTQESDIADADNIPFHDASANKNRKITWSTIRAKLSELFMSTATYGGSADGVVKSADKLQTPRKIGDATFDGTSNLYLSDIGAQRMTTNYIRVGGPNQSFRLENYGHYTFTEALTSLELFFPSFAEYFDCWLKFTAGSSITVTLPENTTYLGSVPTFEPGKTYEMSIKDGCVICAEVVSA